MKSSVKNLFLTLSLILTFASAAVSKEEIPKQMPAVNQKEAPLATGGMDEAAMTKMKEYATPNENHKVLDSLVGSWNYTLKWWMAPDSQPEESTGSSENKWTLGGRFVEQSVEGTSMGQPFEGIGVTGYDNAKKEYVSTWMDNMATGIFTAKGMYAPATKALTESGDFLCPIRGQMSFRWVTKIIDENNYTFESYTNDEKGKEFKSMEIVYKRR